MRTGDKWERSKGDGINPVVRTGSLNRGDSVNESIDKTVLKLFTGISFEEIVVPALAEISFWYWMNAGLRGAIDI
jgi:hypothetical protein